MENDVTHLDEFYFELKQDLQLFDFSKTCTVYLVNRVFYDYILETDIDEEEVPGDSETGTDMEFYVITNLLNVFKIYAKDRLYLETKNAVLLAITIKYGGLEDVAKKLNIESAILGMYCHGIKKPESDIISRASKIYNVPIEEFYEFDKTYNEVRSIDISMFRKPKTE